MVQLDISEEHLHKLQLLAARWGCSEAEALGMALDRLPGDESTFIDRLYADGRLVPPFGAGDVPLDLEGEAFEQEMEGWLDAQAKPFGFSAAVIEDRR